MLNLINSTEFIIFSSFISNINIRSSIQSIEKKQMIQSLKQFIKIVNPECDMIGLVTLKEVIDELNFTQGDHPKKFANYIGTLIDILEVNILDLETKFKVQLFQLVLSSMEIYPSILRKNPQRVLKLFDIIYRVMANISLSISENWLKPPPNYDEDNIQNLYIIQPDTAIVCQFRNFVDRIGIVVGYMKTIQIIQSKAVVYYNDGDWRFKAGVLMCFSQLSEDLNLDKLENVLKILNMGFVDEHPKVRFAAVQLLGQFSDDLKPDFQNKYFNQLMPIIINGFKDNVERVASHWLACMTNFIEDYSQTEQIIPYVNEIFISICKFIQGGMIQSKENALATLSSLVTVPSIFDKDTIKKPFQICHSILQTFSVQEYQQLINQAIQCLTITISSQPYQLVKDYIPFLVEILNQISEKLSPEYFSAGWHRICIKNHKFQNWEPVYQKLLESVKSMPSDIKRSGFDSILCTVDCFKEDFYPFTNETLGFLQTACENGIEEGDEEVTSAAVQTIEQIISKAKPTSPDSIWDNRVKTYVNKYCLKLLELLDQNMYQVLEQMMQSIKSLLNDYSYLYNQQELVQLYSSFWSIAGKLQEKKISIFNNQMANMNFDDNEEVDEDVVKQSHQQELKGINSCKLIIPDIIHTIMKRINNPAAVIKDLLDHISLDINSSIDDQDFRYATYYLDNLLDDYDYNTLKDYWENIYNRLAEFALNPDATLRNSASYGIGILAQKTPTQLVSMPIILHWVDLVKKAYSVPKKESETSKVYGHCQDNCVAVVGKILKSFNKSLDLRFLYQKWLQVLPLKYDQEQNRIQIKYLCEILEKQPEMIINLSNVEEGVKRLKHLVGVFAEVTKHVRSKKYNKQNMEVLKICKQTLKKVLEWGIYQQNEFEITKDLSKGQKFQLKELLNNDLIFED